MRRTPARPLAAVAAAALLACAATASDWTRFRGPNGTGTSPDKDLPVTWSESENLLWKARIPGIGHASPIIHGGKVFLQTAAEDGSWRALVCLDAAKGSVLWAQKMPGSRAHINQKNSRASSTPATDGERVYSLFWDGEEVALYAHDFDGKQLWKRPLGGFKSQHGPATSPIVHDGRVAFVNDQDGSSAVVCVDARTGRELWSKRRRPFRACYSVPFVTESQDGKPELVVATTAGLTGYDLADGSENWNFVWKFDGMALRTVGSPIVADGHLLVSSGDGKGDRHMIAVRAGGKGDVSATHLAWENKKDFPYVPCMLSHGAHVYSVNDRGIAFCHVARTGKQVWSERLGSTVTASPVLVDGKVYVPADDGTVYVFEAAPAFKLLAKNEINEPVSATPAVADNRLFIRGKSHLFCIAKK